MLPNECCPVCGGLLLALKGSELGKRRCSKCGAIIDNGTESTPVNPQHYKEGVHEVIDIIRATLSKEEFEGYLKGNIIKYSCRAGLKGDRAEDIAKRDVYTTWLRKLREFKDMRDPR